MPYDIRVSLVVLLTIGAVVFGVSRMPALTNAGNGTPRGVSQAEFDAVVRQELAYCQAQPDDINCACFAARSGRVLAHKSPKVPTAQYADQQELARGQAALDC